MLALVAVLIYGDAPDHPLKIAVKIGQEPELNNRIERFARDPDALLAKQLYRRPDRATRARCCVSPGSSAEQLRKSLLR